MRQNYWKYIIISLLAAVAVFHISAMVVIWEENYELTSPDYYAEEGAYGELMAQIKAGAMYTWNLDVTNAGLTLSLKDATGETPNLNKVTAVLYKPDKAGLDRTVHLTRHKMDYWTTPPMQLVGGRWRVTLTAEEGGRIIAYRANINLK